jgi:hypothetical protein
MRCSWSPPLRERLFGRPFPIDSSMLRLIVVLALLGLLAEASSGDRLDSFVKCKTEW